MEKLPSLVHGKPIADQVEKNNVGAEHRLQLTVAITEHRNATRQAYQMLKKLSASFPNVTIIDATDAFCSQSICPMVQDGHPILFDDNHLSRTAAWLVVAKIGLDRILASREN